MIKFSLRISIALLLLSFTTEERLHAEPKNVVLFFVDDMGWTDLTCTGSDLYETPNIDALSENSVRFTSGYAACTVCSPSRAALLTGQSPARLHVTDFIPGHPFVNTPLTIPDWTRVLKKEHQTLPELLKPHGYTSAHLGKWHLAERNGYRTGKPDEADPDNYPNAHGFDINIGGCEKGAPPSYFWPYGKGKTLEERKQNTIYETLPDNGKSDAELEGEYLTDRLAEEAERLIDRFARDETPFLLNFWFYNVHTPIQGRPDLVEKYEAKLKENPERKHTNAAYAAMVESVDEAVGRVVSKLKEHNLAGETLIVFTSDNGGLKPAATDNTPIRQGKGGIYEGGVRVPFIVHLPEGGATGELCHEPVITMDLLPTIFEALELELPEEVAAVQDGRSILPLIRNPRAGTEPRSLYWHYPHYHSMGAQPYSAIRSGNWKLIEVIGHDQIELYDLASDIHENRNLVNRELDKAKKLYTELAVWRASVGAQMPTRNPLYDPEKPSGVDRGGKIKPAAATRE
ncbi:MAG: sulfatase [Verrucomicrobiales bacterium]|nr:sulfatase [Verrucomicrobiales bacterium]